MTYKLRTFRLHISTYLQTDDSMSFHIPTVASTLLKSTEKPKHSQIINPPQIHTHTLKRKSVLVHSITQSDIQGSAHWSSSHSQRASTPFCTSSFIRIKTHTRITDLNVSQQQLHLLKMRKVKVKMKISLQTHFPVIPAVMPEQNEVCYRVYL